MIKNNEKSAEILRAEEQLQIPAHPTTHSAKN